MNKEELLAILLRVYNEKRTSEYDWLMSNGLFVDMENALKREGCL